MPRSTGRRAAEPSREPIVLCESADYYRIVVQGERIHANGRCSRWSRTENVPKSSRIARHHRAGRAAFQSPRRGERARPEEVRPSSNTIVDPGAARERAWTARGRHGRWARPPSISTTTRPPLETERTALPPEASDQKSHPARRATILLIREDFPGHSIPRKRRETIRPGWPSSPGGSKSLRLREPYFKTVRARQSRGTHCGRTAWTCRPYAECEFVGAHLGAARLVMEADDVAWRLQTARSGRGCDPQRRNECRRGGGADGPSSFGWNMSITGPRCGVIRSNSPVASRIRAGVQRGCAFVPSCLPCRGPGGVRGLTT